MIETLLSPNNLPFTVALVIALLIGILELLSLLVGGFSDIFETLIPEKEIGIEGSFSLSDYLCIGRIPLLMWLVVYLVSFGLIGTFIQMFLDFNVYIVTLVVFFVSTIPTRYISLFLHKIIPQDETTALYSNSFIGMSANIVSGYARVGYPAQAKFKDIHGQTHYIMVEPEGSEEEYGMGDTVILVKQSKNIFICVKKVYTN